MLNRTKVAQFFIKNTNLTLSQIYHYFANNYVDFDVNDFNDWNSKTLLYIACETQHLNLVKALLAMGANPSFSLNVYQSILQVGLSTKNIELIKILVTAGINLYPPYLCLNDTSKEIQDYFYEAQKKVTPLSSEEINTLAEFFAKHDLSNTMVSGYYPLPQNNTSDFDVLSKDLNAVYEALKIAVAKNDNEIAEIILKTKLIQFGHVYHSTDGTTPLRIAAKQGNLELVKLLISYGDFVINRNPLEEDSSVAEMARKYGHNDIADLIEETLQNRLDNLKNLVMREEQVNEIYNGNGLFESRTVEEITTNIPVLQRGLGCSGRK